jgi:hypothetical protein
VALVGPGGMRVEQVTVVWRGQRGAGVPRRMLRLTRAGRLVGEYRTVEELARYVDLSTLVDELPPTGTPAANT